MDFVAYIIYIIDNILLLLYYISFYLLSVTCRTFYITQINIGTPVYCNHSALNSTINSIMMLKEVNIEGVILPWGGRVRGVHMHDIASWSKRGCMHDVASSTQQAPG